MAKKTKQEAQQERLSLVEKRNRQERRNKKSRKEREQEKRKKKLIMLPRIVHSEILWIAMPAVRPIRALQK